MKITPYLVALAIGLSFASVQALAAKPDRDDKTTQQQHHQNKPVTHRDKDRDRIRHRDQNHPQFQRRRDDHANDRWRDRNRRDVELKRWRRNMHAPHRFHVGVYHGPRGYYYRHWLYGERLPRIYFVQDYWLTDFLMFGLMAPPPGCVWVRFGPDALLIDTETGEIIQVVYDVFY